LRVGGAVGERWKTVDRNQFDTKRGGPVGVGVDEVLDEKRPSRKAF